MSLKKIVLPLFLFSGTIIAFVTSLTSQNSNSSLNISSTTQNSNSSNQKKVDQTASNPNQLQKLSVLPLRCIGCGRCARIDSVHFEMSGSKAIIISSTNLTSSKLASAINNCPVRAIVLK
jgi:ferredoxin